MTRRTKYGKGPAAQNRLVWAGSVGPVPIIPPAATPSNTLTTDTLTAEQYTQSFGYDALGRLTASTASGSYNRPVGCVSYGQCPPASACPVSRI